MICVPAARPTFRTHGQPGARRGSVIAMTGEAGERLLEVLAQLGAVADEVTPDEAAQTLDDATLQVFWRDWPQISSWAGALWRKLNHDLADAARPHGQPDLDDLGGSG